jgi:hypothetical protein
VFNPTPTAGTPGSPRALFQGQSSAPFGLNAGLRSPSGSLQLPPAGFSNGNAAAAATAAAAADAVAAQAALNSGLPPFYFSAAAAAASGGGGTSPLQAAINQNLINQHTVASLAAQQQQQQQQLLQASLSMALANQAAAANPFLQNPYPAALLSPTALEPMRSAGGSLSLDGGLQSSASVTALLQQHQQHQQQLAAVMAAQQQHAAASQLRRNMSTPVAHLGLGSAAAQAHLGLGASALTGSALGLPLSAQMGRLHVTHSADLTAMEAAALLGGAGMGGRPKFSKARKNSEPKIGPDGQPRLNARQRRTLRRAKERALKGLLEVSQALLQKAEVQVIVPNIGHLAALEELAAVEAEKEAANGETGSDSGCLSPTASAGRAAGSGRAPGTRGVLRSQQLAAAAAAVEESVCEIARAAVAAVTAQANGRDTSSAAAAAHAAAANAATAAAGACAVLPPGYGLSEEGGCDELQPCSSDPLESLTHSAPTSPIGSNITAGAASSGRSSSSSISLPGSARCSSSSTGSVASSSYAAKPPLCQPPRPASTTAASGGGCSPLCSPLPSPTPSCGPVAGGSTTPSSAGSAAPLPPTGRGASQLESIDIAGLIGQLSLKKDEGMVDDKLIRDLQIIQSLIGALKAPGSAGASLDGGPSSASGPSLLAMGGPSGSTSPVPTGRHMRASGSGLKTLPKPRCTSPGGVMAGGALHMM